MFQPVKKTPINFVEAFGNAFLGDPPPRDDGDGDNDDPVPDEEEELTRWFKKYIRTQEEHIRKLRCLGPLPIRAQKAVDENIAAAEESLSVTRDNLAERERAAKANNPLQALFGRSL